MEGYMNYLMKLLYHIKLKRKLFVGENGLKALRHLVDGYCQCLEDFGISTYDFKFGFDEYVHKKICGEMDGRSLYSIISDNTDNDDDAFAMYFQLLEEYCAENNIQFDGN